MERILRFDWLTERANSPHPARSGFPTLVPQLKNSVFTRLVLSWVPNVFCLCEAKCFGFCRKRNPRAAKPGSLLRLDQAPKIVQERTLEPKAKVKGSRWLDIGLLLHCVFI